MQHKKEEITKCAYLLKDLRNQHKSQEVDSINRLKRFLLIFIHICHTLENKSLKDFFSTKTMHTIKLRTYTCTKHEFFIHATEY